MIKKKDGFTLIEVMVAMMVTGIILGTVYFFRLLTKSYKDTI